MDNDLKLVRKAKQTIKNVKFFWNYRGLKIADEIKGNERISELIMSESPFCAVRGGATELRCVDEYLHRGNFFDKIRDEISNLSGFFPTDNDSLVKFCELYMECMTKADILALWGAGAESKVVKRCSDKTEFIKLRSLEPYYFENPWSAALENKTVLVVHPFVKTITAQYKQREKLFPGKQVLPCFKDLICIEAVQSIAGEKTDFDSWFDALDYMKSEIDKTDFDIAIIGAGAYGLPLATYCRDRGKQAVQMSGATQILFGIKGKRWDGHPFISQLYNDAWVRPDGSETPIAKNKVEGGSYW